MYVVNTALQFAYEQQLNQLRHFLMSLLYFPIRKDDGKISVTVLAVFLFSILIVITIRASLH